MKKKNSSMGNQNILSPVTPFPGKTHIWWYVAK